MISSALSTIKMPLVFTVLTYLSACSRYEVSVNKRTLYTPPPLLSEYTLVDATLSDCIRKNIEEQNIRKASQLRTLLCPSGNIHDLSGLEAFSRLQKLGLKGNNVEDLGSLAKLRALRQIDLSNNRVKSAAPLTALPKLNYLDLRGNTDLSCDSAKPLIAFLLPEHCIKND